MTSLRMGMRMALSRNLATCTVVQAQAATDPIQQLFADKVKEYAKKKAAAGGALPDASKETLAAIQMELDKVAEAASTCQSPQTSSSPTRQSKTCPSSRFTDNVITHSVIEDSSLVSSNLNLLLL